MTKYQLVFIKLAAAVRKLGQVRETRQLLAKRRAFDRYRECTTMLRQCVGYKAQALVGKMKAALQTLVSTCRGLHAVSLARSMRRWRQVCWTSTILSKHELNFKAAEDAAKLALARKDRTLAELEQKLQTTAAEIAHLKASKITLRQTLKDSESKEQALLESLQKSKQKQREDKTLPRKSDNKLQALEQQLAALEQIRQKLRERLDSTENGVGLFVNEMNEMLDSHEFAGIEGLGY